MSADARLYSGACERDEDSSRWAFAWESKVFAFVLKASTASAPAAKRAGGSSCTVKSTSAAASLAGSPLCLPFMPFQVVTVSLVRDA